MSRRYLNLVVHDFRSRLYSVRRIDLRKHLFPVDSEAAQVASENKNKRVMGGWKKLPPPAINFQPAPSSLNSRFAYLFSLLGGENNILYADASCQTALYSIDSNFVESIPSPRASKRSNVISLPITQGDPVNPIKPQSLYFLDLSPTSTVGSCFEVLLYREKEWCWDVLPPPPFFSDPETVPDMYSYAVVDGSDICISPSDEEEGIGTYTFDTVSREWRQAADWALPFFGKAEYVPELNLWIGLSGLNPFSSLCAFDLSAMDSVHPPMPLHTWDYLDLPEDQPWFPTQLHLLNLGLGKFCVATFFGTTLRTCSRLTNTDTSDDEDMHDKEYAVFTPLEVRRSSGDGSLRLIKHMSKRYAAGRYNIECVL